jgi:hypothetical protein
MNLSFDQTDLLIQTVVTDNKKPHPEFSGMRLSVKTAGLIMDDACVLAEAPSCLV